MATAVDASIKTIRTAAEGPLMFPAEACAINVSKFIDTSPISLQETPIVVGPGFTETEHSILVDLRLDFITFFYHGPLSIFGTERNDLPVICLKGHGKGVWRNIRIGKE
jgi:hypothetical protein